MDVSTAFSGENEPVTAQENEPRRCTIEMWWSDQILNKQCSYTLKLVKTPGRLLDDCLELLYQDLLGGWLPTHILLKIAKLQGKCKAFLLVQFMAPNMDPGFKEHFIFETR